MSPSRRGPPPLEDGNLYTFPFLLLSLLPLSDRNNSDFPSLFRNMLELELHIHFHSSKRCRPWLFSFSKWREEDNSFPFPYRSAVFFFFVVLRERLSASSCPSPHGLRWRSPPFSVVTSRIPEKIADLSLPWTFLVVTSLAFEDRARWLFLIPPPSTCTSSPPPPPVSNSL